MVNTLSNSLSKLQAMRRILSNQQSVVLSPLLLAGHTLEKSGWGLIRRSCLNLPVLTLPQLLATRTLERTDWTTNRPIIPLLKNKGLPTLWISTTVYLGRDYCTLLISVDLAVWTPHSYLSVQPLRLQ